MVSNLLNGKKVFFDILLASFLVDVSWVHPLFVFFGLCVLKLEFGDLFEVFLACHQGNIFRWDKVVLAQHSEPLSAIVGTDGQRIKWFTCIELGSVVRYVSIFGLIDLSV